MFIPYKVDVPMARWPVGNFVLMGLIVVISIAMFPALGQWREDVQGIAMMAYFTDGAFELPAPEGPLRYFLLFPGHWHPFQLVGHMFLHGDLIHLAGNMLFLFVFGNAVNAKLGHWKFLLLFLGIGVLDGVAGLMLESRPSLGASGAIMGVVGAFLLLYPLNDISVAYWFSWFWRGVMEVSAGWIIALYVAFDIWGMIFQRDAGVGYLAHVLGFALGASVTAAILWWKHLEMDRDEKSLLQVMGWMPCAADEEIVVERTRLNPVTGRPFAPVPARNAVAAAAGGTPLPGPRPPAPRKPRDEGPIPLD